MYDESEGLDMKKPVFLAFALAAGSGCATILHGPNTSVTISADVAPATVVVDGVERGTAPVAVNLANSIDHQVVVRAATHERVFQLTHSLGVGWIVLDVITGFFGLITDAMTGSWYHLSHSELFASFSTGISPTGDRVR